jgi:sec-independent protein translocase protein TatA
MPNIGPMELAIVAVIALLILGPKRLPSAGRSLGRGIREFKGSIGGSHDDDDEDDKPQLEPESAKVHGDPADAEVLRNKSG